MSVILQTCMVMMTIGIGLHCITVYTYAFAVYRVYCILLMLMGATIVCTFPCDVEDNLSYHIVRMLPICLSVCLSSLREKMCMSVCLSVCLSVILKGEDVYVCLSVCLSS